MLLLLLTTGSARAAPSATLTSAQAVGVVGFEQWSGSASPISGLQARLGLYHRQDVQLRGALSSEMLWWAGSPYDFHLGELSISGLGAMAPGGSVVASGSVSSGFSEVTPAITGRLHTGPHSLQLRVGPSLRMSMETATGTVSGGNATALWTLSASPSLSIWALLDGDLWPNSMLPERIITSDLGARWCPSPPLTLSSSVGLSVTGGQSEGWIAGLPPSGSRVLRGRLSADRRINSRLGLRIELLGDRGYGALSYGHARVTAGLTTQLRRLRSTPGPPEVLSFALIAPDAATVDLVGSFSEWRPIPMTQDADGTWRVELSLPIGVYEYVYLIDGQPLTPPEAARYQDDGFGGRNGVLIIGE